jgi:hypothetical protein
VPLTNIGTSSLAAAQISRTGAGANTHPTLNSPVRGVNGAVALTNNAVGGGYRGGGFDASNAGGAQRGGFNPGFNSVGNNNSSPVNSGSSGGFSPAVSARGGGGAPAAASAGGNVGGGVRGR